MKVFIDTSVIVRFFVNDDPIKFEHTRKLFQKIESGAMRAYISNIVILETAFVLSKVYKLSKPDVINYLEALLNARNLVVVERTDMRSALHLYKDLNVKLADILIALQVPKGCTLCTYDKDFEKLNFVKVSKPEELE